MRYFSELEMSDDDDDDDDDGAVVGVNSPPRVVVSQLQLLMHPRLRRKTKTIISILEVVKHR